MFYALDITKKKRLPIKLINCFIIIRNSINHTYV